MSLKTLTVEFSEATSLSCPWYHFIYYFLFLFCSSSTWCCLHCLKVNSLQDVLCEECELPRIDLFNTKADESPPKPGLSDTVNLYSLP